MPFVKVNAIIAFFFVNVKHKQTVEFMHISQK